MSKLKTKIKPQKQPEGVKIIHIDREMIQMIAYISPEIVESRKLWQNVLKDWKKKSGNIILYLVLMSFRNEIEIMTFSDEGQLRQFITNKFALKTVSKGS